MGGGPHSLSPRPLFCFPSVFWDLYCAAPDRRETCEHSSEAKAFHDYVSAWGWDGMGWGGLCPGDPSPALSVPSPSPRGFLLAASPGSVGDLFPGVVVSKGGVNPLGGLDQCPLPKGPPSVAWCAHPPLSPPSQGTGTPHILPSLTFWAQDQVLAVQQNMSPSPLNVLWGHCRSGAQ